MSLGCKIVKNFKRPDKSLLSRFSNLAVSDLDDTMSKLAAVDHSIRALNKYSGSMVGTAFTIKLPHGDNLMFRAAIQYVQPGDVVVIDAGGFDDRAVAGEVTAKYCRARGAKGLIIDGATRDSAVLSQMEDFYVFVRAISPNGPYFNGPGEVNVPVVCGGQLVCPGDIVVADADGVIFINPEHAEEVLAQSSKITQRDQTNLKQLEETGTCDQSWVEKKLSSLGCEFEDMADYFHR